MNIPTAEEFIGQGIKEGLGLDIKKFKEENPVLYATIKSIVLKSNKLHVEAALKSAKQASIDFHEGTTHLEEQIGRSYPLTNIK